MVTLIYLALLTTIKLRVNLFLGMRWFLMIGEQLTVNHSSDSNPVPAVSQPLPALVGLPTSLSSDVKVTGEGISRKPTRPTSCPPALQLSPCEMPLGSLFESAVPVNSQASPSSSVTVESIRTSSPSTRPPPLVLHPRRVVRKVSKIGFNTVQSPRGSGDHQS